MDISSTGHSPGIASPNLGGPVQQEDSGNLFLAVVAGLVVAAVCAGLWAGITVATGYHVGLVAIAIGIAVGFTVRFVGKGNTVIFGVVGASCALLSCMAGITLTTLVYVARTNGVDILSLLGDLDMAFLQTVFIETFEPFDLVFYGIAIYEGYKFSIMPLSK
jgi:hypothetical protein